MCNRFLYFILHPTKRINPNIENRPTQCATAPELSSLPDKDEVCCSSSCFGSHSIGSGSSTSAYFNTSSTCETGIILSPSFTLSGI